MPIFSKKENIRGSKTVTIIAEGVRVQGDIISPGSTRIDGSLKGKIVSQKELVIGKDADVEAAVKTTDVIIAGTFKGDMVASGEVEITPTGSFIGTLTQKDALLTVSKGGVFKGESLISDDSGVFKFDEEIKDIQESEDIKEKSKTG